MYIHSLEQTLLDRIPLPYHTTAVVFKQMLIFHLRVLKKKKSMLFLVRGFQQVLKSLRQ